MKFIKMKDLFNFDRSTVISTKDKLGVKTARKNKKALLRQTKRDENFKTIIEDCGGLPAEHEYVAIKTNGTSDCGSIFSYILSQWDVVTEMYLATWTISKNNVKRIRDAILTGKIKHLTLVFSSTLKPANPALYATLVGELKDFDVVNLKEVNSHAKTFSMSNGKDHITVTGSANWSENPRIENFILINDKHLFDHHKDWMSELATMT